MPYLCVRMNRVTYSALRTQFAPEAVVVADGDFPRHDVPLSALREAAYTCCCDGALEAMLAHGLMPQAVVGDGDTLSFRRQQQFADILHIEREQEDNDLTKATRFCMALGYRRIAYVGATGKREDHTLGNISLMEQYLRQWHLEPVMLTDYGYFLPVLRERRLQTFPGQQVSVFNFSCTRLESAGLRWQTYPFTSWWQGSLNEALGSEALLRGDGTCVVFLSYEAKRTGGGGEPTSS